MLVQSERAPAIFQRVTAEPATTGSIVGTVLASGFISDSNLAARPLILSDRSRASLSCSAEDIGTPAIEVEKPQTSASISPVTRLH